jgi:hypothetical protein
MREVVMLSNSPWCPQDLFFMGNSIRRGSSFGEVAGFLSRTEEEVRRKAEELGIKQCLGIAAAGHERRMGGRERVAARSQTRCTDGVAIKRPSPSSAIASPQAH